MPGLARRLDRLAARHQQVAQEIDREVFRRSRAEAAADIAARRRALADAGMSEEDASRLLVEEAAADPAGFAARWEEMGAQYDAEHGTRIEIAGCGWIGERDYTRLRAAVTMGAAP